MWAYWACFILFYLVRLVGLLMSSLSYFSLVPTGLAYWAFCLIPSSSNLFKAHSYSLKRVIQLWLTLPHCPYPMVSQCALFLVLYGHSLSLGPYLGYAFLLFELLGCSLIALLSLLFSLLFLVWFGLFLPFGFGPILSKMSINI